MKQLVRVRDALRARGIDFWLFIGSVVIVLIPIVVATARALHHDWLPVGDDAFFVVRARDVFGAHRPLLGTWTSASTTVGTDLNNPGPLLFDVLAPFVGAFGGDAGVAIGAAVINALTVLGIAVVAYRRGGALLGTVAMVVTALLAWSMGSELLFDPWQPHVLILPFLFFLMLTWAAGTGDLVALPLLAGVGSLLVQSHLSYAFLVPSLAVMGIAAAAFTVYRRRRREPDAWPRIRRHVGTVSAIAAAVLVVCWIQPLIEQFTSDDAGNMTRLTRSFGADVKTPGAGWATQAVASVLSLPPFWWRHSFDETFFANTGLRLGDSSANLWSPPATGVAAASLVALVALLSLCGVLAWRSRDRRALFALVLAAAGALVGFATIARAPVTVLGNLTPHSARWLWGLGAFMLFGMVATIVRARPLRRYHTAIIGVLTGVTAIAAVCNLPAAPSANGPQSQGWAIAGVRALRPQLATLEGDGPFLVDGLYDVVFDPYGTAVVADLQRRDIPFVVSDDVLVRQLGDTRRVDGDEATAALVLRIGDGAFAPFPGARRVAVYEALSPAEQRKLAALSRQIEAYVERRDPGVDAHQLVASREILDRYERGLLKFDGQWARRLREYADLQLRWDRRTVGVFAVPIRGDEQ
jgi:hypothetical protein